MKQTALNSELTCIPWKVPRLKIEFPSHGIKEPLMELKVDQTTVSLLIQPLRKIQACV